MDIQVNHEIHPTDGEKMYQLMTRLFPICRSITGNGVRDTLHILQEMIPLQMEEVPSGTPVFDWIVPKEWNIRDAYILDEHGQKIIDFKNSNLHVVGYSIPIDAELSLDELQKHLFSIEEQPDAIPYITSYYKEFWGFCLTHHQRLKLKDGTYRVYIDSELKDGSLTYGELMIPGQLEEEVFLSTYICHPSLANNELSGPVVATFLAQWILSQARKYTYRIVFVPETIGSITYLSRHLPTMKKRIVAGFNLTCVGDERGFSYLPTRLGNTLSDKVALYVLQQNHPEFIAYSYLDRGSDERQYCSPGVDLPVASIMRSKYSEYPEYHTSLDNLDLVSAQGLQVSLAMYQECITLIEENQKYRVNCLCEPQLGKRGLYPTISTKDSSKLVKTMMNFIAYADGQHDLIDISQRIQVPVKELYPIIEKLKQHELLA